MHNFLYISIAESDSTALSLAESTGVNKSESAGRLPMVKRRLHHKYGWRHGRMLKHTARKFNHSNRAAAFN